MISIERKIRKQNKKRLWISALILVFVISLLFGIVYLCRKDKEIDYYYVYDRLIASMIPGKTEDEIYNDFVVMHERSISPSHQEIANLIIAESLHYSYNQDEKSRMIIRQGTKYLLDIAQETYVNGYGLYDSWDAFGDGSVNPSDTSYTITNATVLDAFLDVLDLNVLENREREEVERLINTIIIDWCSYYFTEKNGEEGYFWYSNQKVDDKDSPNVSAEFAGVIAKALYQEPDLFDIEEKRLIEKEFRVFKKELFLKQI